MKNLLFFTVHLLLLAPLVANAQVYYADLYALTNAYKLYSTPTDFYNDKYVEADKLTGKGYTKEKAVVMKKDEVLVYKMHPIAKTVSKYALVIRPTKDINFRNYPVAYFPVLITGSLCLYFNGFLTEENGSITKIETTDEVPCYASQGLDGEVFSFGKLDNKVVDDPQLLEDLKNLKKTRGGGKLGEYVADRVKIILDYNNRHPSGHPEMNIFEEVPLY